MLNPGAVPTGDIAKTAKAETANTSRRLSRKILQAIRSESFQARLENPSKCQLSPVLMDFVST
jgi:hypothetical protein